MGHFRTLHEHGVACTRQPVRLNELVRNRISSDIVKSFVWVAITSDLCFTTFELIGISKQQDENEWYTI